MIGATRTLADRLQSEISELRAKLAEAERDLAEHLGEGEALGQSLPDVIARQTGMGERFPTGLATLDSLTGGGIPRGRLVALVGKPGVGKTSLATQIAMHMARNRRAAVLALYADSGLDDAAITLAQQLGIPREQAIAGSPEAVAGARRETFGLSLVLVDPDQPYDLADLAARFVHGLPEGVAPILLLDSAQVLRCPDPRAKTPYERITAISNAAKAVTSRHRLVTLLVSQSNRASYANKAIAKDADPLAAGAGAAALEFMPDVHLSLDPVGEFVRMTCAKSRIGRSGWSVMLSIDFERHRHLEVDAAVAEAEAQDAETQAKNEQIRAAREKCLQVARRNPEGLSSARMEDLCGGRASIHREARRLAWEAGDLICEERSGRGGGALWKPATLKGVA